MYVLHTTMFAFDTMLTVRETVRKALTRPVWKRKRACRCALLTGAVEARGDRVEEGVLRGEKSPHHRHPAPRGAAPRSPTRVLLPLRLSAEAGQESGGTGCASQPLQERPDPRAATLQCGGGGGAARMPTPSTQKKHARSFRASTPQHKKINQWKCCSERTKERQVPWLL